MVFAKQHDEVGGREDGLNKIRKHPLRCKDEHEPVGKGSGRLLLPYPGGVEAPDGVVGKPLTSWAFSFRLPARYRAFSNKVWICARW